MSLYKDASLVMIPSAYKDGKLYSIRPTDGSGDFTFSRGSNLAATRVDVNGLIEKGRENLLTYSNDFSNGVWAKSNLSVALSNGAWEVTDNTTSGSHYIYWGGTTPASTILTLSVEAKAGSVDYLAMRLGGFTYAFFDVANGTLGAANPAFIDTKIEATSNGFYKCSATILTPSSGSASVFYPTDNNGIVSYTGTGALAITIKNAQLEQGLVATDYIETGASTAQAGILEDMPRLDYSGGASCPALLLEPQRTNLVVQSEYFGAWVDAGTTTILSTTTNPSGYSQSYIISAASSATNALRYDLTFSASTDYSYSLFLKAGTSEEVRMQIYDGNTFKRLAVNPLNNFAVVDQSGINSYSIEDFSNGWKRVSMNFSSTASAGVGYLQIYPDRTGNLNNVEVYGATLEQGSYPTSYIPTYGSSVTRSRDFMNEQISSLTSLEQGTFFIDFDRGLTTATARDASSDGFFYRATSSFPSANAIEIATEPNGNVRLALRTPVVFLGSAYQNNTLSRYKMLVKWNGSEVKTFVNGVNTYTSSTKWGEMSAPLQYMGYNADFRKSVNQVATYPTALTDSECIALTTL